MVRAWVEIAVWWVVLVLVWLATLNALSWQELVVAAGLALPCAVAARYGRRAAGISLRPSPRWVRWLPALVRGIAHDTVGVLRGGGGSGEFHEVTLPADADPSRAWARAALATLIVSATPGSLVVDTTEHGLYVHTLPVEDPALTRAVRR